MLYVLLVLAAYALGSIPFALIVAKLAGRGDIRKVGSGNVGATNVARVAGIGGFMLTFVLDMGKAFGAVLLGTFMVSPVFGALCGFFAIVGHCFPIWLKFRGGKGNSCVFGILLAVHPLMFLVVGIEWLVAAVASGYSSLGAIVGFFVMPILGFAMNDRIGLIFLAIMAVCLFQHRGNIQRLIAGTEAKIQMSMGKMVAALVTVGVIILGILVLFYV